MSIEYILAAHFDGTIYDGRSLLTLHRLVTIFALSSAKLSPVISTSGNPVQLCE